MSIANRRLMLALPGLLLAVSLVACGTTANQRKLDQRELAYNSLSSDKMRNFGLYRERDLDRRWLKRGQRAMASSAFDSSN